MQVVYSQPDQRVYDGRICRLYIVSGTHARYIIELRKFLEVVKVQAGVLSDNLRIFRCSLSCEIFRSSFAIKAGLNLIFCHTVKRLGLYRIYSRR